MTQKTARQQSRVKFEELACQAGISDDFERAEKNSEEYFDIEVNAAWWGWQAALSTQKENENMFPELNPNFEQWVAKQTFSGLDVPLSEGTENLMQRAYEAGRQWQANRDATMIESLSALNDAMATTQDEAQNRRGEFAKELESLINRHSQENDSDTPDFILAGYLRDCLSAWNAATKARERWYGRPCGNRAAPSDQQKN